MVRARLSAFTAFFIETGWTSVPEMGGFGADDAGEPHTGFVDPVITYLLPLLIAGQRGRMAYGLRGGVVGALATMGVIVGTAVPMFLGAMIIGPLAAFVMKRLDAMPAKVLFLNNAINHGALTPLGIQEAVSEGAPYVLMKPITLLAMIPAGMVGIGTLMVSVRSCLPDRAPAATCRHCVPGRSRRSGSACLCRRSRVPSSRPWRTIGISVARPASAAALLRRTHSRRHRPGRGRRAAAV